MLSHKHQLRFCEEMVDGGGLMAARDEAHGCILNEFEGLLLGYQIAAA
jgi:hypothetical protein